MKKAILAVVVSLVACGGASLSRSGAALTGAETQLSISWDVPTSSSCTTGYKPCKGSLASDAGYVATLAQEYQAAGCWVGSAPDGVYVQCECDPCLQGQSPTPSCRQAPHTGPSCSWTP